MQQLLNIILISILISSNSAFAELDVYPPSGSIDPGGPCQREPKAEWVEFFCTYITGDLWNAAGNPDFVTRNGRHYQPYYYVSESNRTKSYKWMLTYEDLRNRPIHDGILEAMFTRDSYESEKNKYLKQINFWSYYRYTPWSVYFERLFGCNEYQIINPYNFLYLNYVRNALLSFGWPEVSKDANDPTSDFPEEAYLVSLMMVDLIKTLDLSQKMRLPGNFKVVDEINAIAAGGGNFKPDYGRDGEVWLFRPDGSADQLADLDIAAAYVVGTGVLMTNEAMRTWQDNVASMKHYTSKNNRPVVSIYFAQDWFPPVDNNRIYRARYNYLIDKASLIANKTDSKFILVGEGRNSNIVLHASQGHQQIDKVVLLAPIPGPWGKREYYTSLTNDNNIEKRILAGNEDPFTLVGYGVAYKTIRLKECLN